MRKTKINKMKHYIGIKDFCFNCTPILMVSNLNFHKFSGEGLIDPFLQTSLGLSLQAV